MAHYHQQGCQYCHEYWKIKKVCNTKDNSYLLQQNWIGLLQQYFTAYITKDDRGQMDGRVLPHFSTSKCLLPWTVTGRKPTQQWDEDDWKSSTTYVPEDSPCKWMI